MFAARTTSSKRSLQVTGNKTKQKKTAEKRTRGRVMMLPSLASESKASFEEAEEVGSENPNTKELIEDNGVVVGSGSRVDEDEEGGGGRWA